MIKLEALARTEGGLLLIMLVCLLAGLVIGLLLGYGVGYLVGLAKGKKLSNLTTSLDDLTRTLSGLRIKKAERTEMPARVEKQPEARPNPAIKFKKFPV